MNFTPPSVDLRREKRQVALLALAVCCIFLVSLWVQLILLYFVQRYSPALLDRAWFQWAASG